MTKHAALFFSLILVALLCTPAAANGVQYVHDVHPTDLNVVHQDRVSFDGINLYVPETYGETRRIPYPSHDGQAIVNPDGGFFDKIITLPLFPPGIVILEFEVLNATPYHWSDYHFEFWSPDYETPLRDFPILEFDGSVIVENDIFENWSFDGHTLNFWSPAQQAPGQRNTFGMAVDFRPLLGQQIISFGVRQIATTPEPGTAVLAGLGLLAMGWTVRRRRRS